MEFDLIFRSDDSRRRVFEEGTGQGIAGSSPMRAQLPLRTDAATVLANWAQHNTAAPLGLLVQGERSRGTHDGLSCLLPCLQVSGMEIVQHVSQEVAADAGRAQRGQHIQTTVLRLCKLQPVACSRTNAH